MAHDVFISYSTKNKVIADAVCAKLEENGIRVWIAPRDVPAGENFANAIIKAIDDCKVFVLIWSEHTSEHILTEINHAFDQDVVIIPFRIQNIQPTNELRYYLGRTHWLDAIDPPLEKHIMALIETIRAHLNVKQEQKIDLRPNEEPVETPKSEQQIRSENQGRTANQSKLPKALFFVGGALLILTLVLVMVLKSLGGQGSNKIGDQTMVLASQQTEVSVPVVTDTTDTSQFPNDLAGVWKSDDMHAPDGSWAISYSIYLNFKNGQQIVYHGDSEYLNDQPADVSDIVYVSIKDSIFVKKMVENPSHPEAVGKYQKWSWTFDNGPVLFTIYPEADSLQSALDSTYIFGTATGVFVK